MARIGTEVVNEDLDPAPRLPPSPGERRVILVAFGLFFGLLAVELLRELTAAKLGLLFLLLAWGPLLVIHELGHAIAAHWVGWRVGEIVIGFGRELTCFQVGSTLVRIKAAPVEGYVLPSPSRLRSPRLESAFIYFAGPGAELLVLWGLYVLADGRLFIPTDEPGLLALQGAAAAIGLGLFFNLLPLPLAGGVTDGLGIIISLFRSPSDFRAMLLAPSVREATRALILEYPEPARDVLQQGLDRYGEVPEFSGLLAVAHAVAGESDEAHAVLDGLEADNVDACRAWVLLEAPDPGGVPFARRAAERAVSASPHSVVARVLLGRAFLELGLNLEAFAQLMAGYKMARTSEEEGWCLAYLALASHRAVESGQDAAEQPPHIEGDYPERFRAALDGPPIVSAALRRRVEQELGASVPEATGG